MNELQSAAARRLARQSQRGRELLIERHLVDPRPLSRNGGPERLIFVAMLTVELVHHPRLIRARQHAVRRRQANRFICFQVSEHLIPGSFGQKIPQYEGILRVR